MNLANNFDHLALESAHALSSYGYRNPTDKWDELAYILNRIKDVLTPSTRAFVQTAIEAYQIASEKGPGG